MLHFLNVMPGIGHKMAPNVYFKNHFYFTSLRNLLLSVNTLCHQHKVGNVFIYFYSHSQMAACVNSVSDEYKINAAAFSSF